MACAMVEDSARWSSPISASTPPCFDEPARLAWRKTSPERSTPGPLPYQTENTPSCLPSPSSSACCEPQQAVAASSSLRPGWKTMSGLGELLPGLPQLQVEARRAASRDSRRRSRPCSARCGGRARAASAACGSPPARRTGRCAPCRDRTCRRARHREASFRHLLNAGRIDANAPRVQIEKPSVFLASGQASNEIGSGRKTAIAVDRRPDKRTNMAQCAAFHGEILRGIRMSAHLRHRDSPDSAVGAPTPWPGNPASAGRAGGRPDGPPAPR